MSDSETKFHQDPGVSSIDTEDSESTAMIIAQKWAAGIPAAHFWAIIMAVDSESSVSILETPGSWWNFVSESDIKKINNENIIYKLVGLTGLEPATSCTPCIRATNCATAR